MKIYHKLNWSQRRRWDQSECPDFLFRITAAMRGPHRPEIVTVSRLIHSFVVKRGKKVKWGRRVASRMKMFGCVTRSGDFSAEMGIPTFIRVRNPKFRRPSLDGLTILSGGFPFVIRQEILLVGWMELCLFVTCNVFSSFILVNQPLPLS